MKLLILLALAVSAVPALADRSLNDFEKSGLAGTWAEDCSRPPQDGNWYDKFAAVDGQVTETLLNGAAKPYRVTPLRDFRLFTPTRLAYVMDSQGEILDLILDIEGKRHHTWLSVARGGNGYILDGKLVTSGADATWFNKCEK